MAEHTGAYIRHLLAKYGLSDRQWAERVELARLHLIERGEDNDISAVFARHEGERLDLALKQLAEIAVFESRDEDVD